MCLVTGAPFSSSAFGSFPAFLFKGDWLVGSQKEVDIWPQCTAD